MIIVNPQWQGIGRKNPVPEGAAYLTQLLDAFEVTHIPLDDRDLVLKDNVKGLEQIADLIETTQATIRRHNPDTIFTCGGDCSSDFAQLAYLNEKYDGDFSLIWVDAHADLNTPESSPSKNFHGMPIRTLMGEGADALTRYVTKPLAPSQLSFFGLRSVDPEETRFIAAHNIPVHTTAQIRSAAGNYPILPHKNLYIHVDIDSLDETVFSDCATPTSGGFQLNELLSLIQHYTQNYNIIGGCMTEYGPQKPHSAEDIVREILLNGFNVEKTYKNDLKIAKAS